MEGLLPFLYRVILSYADGGRTRAGTGGPDSPLLTSRYYADDEQLL